MRLILSLLLALTPITALAADPAAPTGQVLLTIGGKIALSNTAPATSDDTTLAGFLGVEYDKGVAHDAAMLAALPQHQITATLLDSAAPVTYSGPRLSDLLGAVGAAGKSATPMALDGYSAEITWPLIETHQPILATHANGTPFPIGGLGPTMVVFPPVADTELAATLEALQVFAAFYIGIE